MKFNAKIKQLMVSLAIGAAGAPGLAQQVVKIDGSSTVYPITEGIAEDFQKLVEDYGWRFKVRGRILYRAALTLCGR